MRLAVSSTISEIDAFCETKLFLAYKDNKIVGRIAGLINHAYNEKWNKNYSDSLKLRTSDTHISSERS